MSSTTLGPNTFNLRNYYVFHSKIDENAYSKTYLIKKIDSNAFRLVKVFNKKTQKQIIANEEIKKEISKLVKITNQNILKLYQVYVNDKNLSYIIDHFEGTFLSMNIREYRKKSEVIIGCIMYQIFLTLIYCHKNKIIHINQNLI